MTVTMYNRETDVRISGIHVAYISCWTAMGFEVEAYESDKIVLLQKAS
jgi:hypothetical protein